MYACFKDTIEMDGEKVKILDVLNPKGTFVDGKRLREWSMKGLPALSGRLLPEFDRRRNIKDMFTRKPSLSKSASSLQDNDVCAQIPLKGISTRCTTSDSKAMPSNNGATHDHSAKLSKPAVQSPPAIRPKRSATDEDIRKPLKRTKPEVKITPSTNTGGKGQQSLRGFFKPKTSALTQCTEPDASSLSSVKVDTDETELYSATNTMGEILSPPSQQSQVTATSEEREKSKSFETAPPGTPDRQSPNKSMTESPLAKPASPFVDPIVSKESWTKLFTKPAPPRCEGHDEPCVIYKTKKNGINCGREFWLCPR